MVRYYGRAKTRVGSVNTNQLGLKMSGCPSKIGKQGALVRYQSRRAQCNQKFIGPVYYHGQMWSWNNTGVERAPRNQSFNSGVGHINAPKFACGNTCATELTLKAAFDIIFKYFSALADSSDYIPVLVGAKETLKSDLGDVYDALLKPIQHLQLGNTYYDNAPSAVKKAILSVNSKDLTFKIKGNLRKHIVGLVTSRDRYLLYDNGFGIELKLSPTSVVVAFGDSQLGSESNTYGGFLFISQYPYTRDLSKTGIQFIWQDVNNIIKSSGTTLTQENAAQELINNWGIKICINNVWKRYTFSGKLKDTDKSCVYLKTNTPTGIVGAFPQVKFFLKQ